MRTFLFTSIAMIAFAANSILCRLALAQGDIDAGSFTLIRLLSGALILLSIHKITSPQIVTYGFKPSTRFTWLAGASLFGYAALFSYAYLNLAAGTGALLLFGAVQLTLLGLYWCQGQRFNSLEWLGIAMSIAGFTWLMLPSVSRPDLVSALLMMLSGVCWAAFTALGKQVQSPNIGITWGFAMASLIAALCSPLLLSNISLTVNGVLLAVISGAVTSGLGYLLWYKVLKQLSLLQAAVSQLCVPALAIVIGAMLLGEPISTCSIITSLVILGGIALVFISRHTNSNKTPL
ncbi:DMT family transporter [Vibrio gallicus]|uniref:DMT family transporter n=1 Tax=Vibrio gallicus TaxID=190897 RepID=UPI0021C2CFBD|nr:DMT family transporter [Vibrio gallicus]